MKRSHMCRRPYAELDMSRACSSQGSITSGGPKSALYHLKIMLMVTSRAPWSSSTSPACTLSLSHPGTIDQLAICHTHDNSSMCEVEVVADLVKSRVVGKARCC